MKINISVDLFPSPIEAFGEVSGDLELVAVPMIGSIISFLFANNGTLSINVEGFPGILKVTDVRFTPQSLGAPVSVKLEDVVLKSKDDARKVMKYLEEGFGLFGDEYEPDS